MTYVVRIFPRPLIASDFSIKEEDGDSLNVSVLCL